MSTTARITEGRDVDLTHSLNLLRVVKCDMLMVSDEGGTEQLKQRNELPVLDKMPYDWESEVS